MDEFSLTLGRPTVVFPSVHGPAPAVTADSGSLHVMGRDFSITFSRQTGLITEGSFRGRRFLEGGPYLNFGAVSLPGWWLTKLAWSTTPEEAIVDIAGRYMSVTGNAQQGNAEFKVRIDGAGLITTEYTAYDLPQEASEVGVAYVLSGDVDQITWQKSSLWSAYPAGQIGRPRGMAMKAGGPVENYRAEPAHPWSEDSADFFLFGNHDSGGRGSNDFRSLKADVYFASCVVSGTNLRLRAESHGPLAVRAQIGSGGEVTFNLDNLWGYPDLAWGNLSGPLNLPKIYTNTVRMRLTDSDDVPLNFEDVAPEAARVPAP